MSKFYVYLHLDPRVKSSFIYGQIRLNYEPFYVGKGSGHRAFLLKRNHSYNEYIKNLEREKVKPIIKVFPCSSEASAYAVERVLTSIIGRKDLGTGPLTNLCDGGGFCLSEEANLKKASRIKETRANWPPHVKINYSNKIKNTVTSIWANRSREERTQISKNIGLKSVEAWKTKTRENIIEIKNKELYTRYFKYKGNVYFMYEPNGKIWILPQFKIPAVFKEKFNVKRFPGKAAKAKYFKIVRAGHLKGWIIINLGHINCNLKRSKPRIELTKRIFKLLKSCDYEVNY